MDEDGSGGPAEVGGGGRVDWQMGREPWSTLGRDGHTHCLSVGSSVLEHPQVGP
jgi:hypothetical protein